MCDTVFKFLIHLISFLNFEYIFNLIHELYENVRCNLFIDSSSETIFNIFI